MSGKRRDNKGRVLRNGESQRKDGKYEFKYTNARGERHSVYSWKLVETDKMPAGKKPDLSLREKEKSIQKDIDDGIMCENGLTVQKLVEKYASQKNGVKYNTKRTYISLINILSKDPFSMKSVDSVKISDAKEWLIKLKDTDNKSYGTVSQIRAIVKPAFDMAVRDGYIRKNPFDFSLKDIITNDSKKELQYLKKKKKTFCSLSKVITSTQNIMISFTCF